MSSSSCQTDDEHSNIGTSSPSSISASASIDDAPTPPSCGFKDSGTRGSEEDGKKSDKTESFKTDNRNTNNNAGGGLDRRTVVRCITQRIVAMAIEELNQAETRVKIKDHVISPLIKLIYAQMFPYLIVAAIILLSALVMWVLMFTMFTLSYFRK